MNTGPHLTPEGISAAVEGLLSEADQHAAEAHLAGCERCLSAQEELDGLRVLLRQAGSEPLPMPDEITHRLESALTAESSERGSQTGVVSMAKARRSKHAAEPSKARRRLVPALAAAAGVAAIAVGGTVGYQVLIEGQQMSSSAPQSSNSAEGDSEKPMQAPGTAAAGGYVIAGAPTLTADGFQSEVRDAVQPATKSDPKIQGAAPQGEPEEGVAPKTGSPADERCAEVTAVESGAQSVLDVAPVRFDGTKALLVITESQSASTVDAYVVTGCPNAGSVAHHDTVTVDQ